MVLRLLFTHFLLIISYLANGQQKISDVVAQTLGAIKAVNSASYNFKNTERIQGQLLTGEQSIVYVASPYQVILEFITPRRGTTIYFQKGKNNDKLVYDPVGFPYTKVYLDPLGDLARDRNHHTIFEVGFASIGRIIDHLYQNYPHYFTLHAEEAILGKKMIKIVFENPDYKLITHTSQTDQSTKSIAQQYFVNEYALLDRNKHLKEFGKLKAGTVIKVPNCYAKKMVLWIDKDTMLPAVQEFYDDLGLYEQYVYSNVKVNDSSIGQVMLKRAKEFVQ